MQVNEVGSRIRHGLRGLAAAALGAAAALALLAAPAPAAAAEASTITAAVPVEFSIAGSPAATPTFSATMEAAEDESVAPDQATVQVEGAGKASFTVTLPAKPGIHHYTVRQVAGNETNWTYDGTVYDVTVTVSWSEPFMKELVVTTAVHKQGEDESKKCDSCSFVNTYTEPAKPEEPTKPASAKGKLTKAGDTTSYEGAAALGLAGVAVVAAAVVVRRRKAE